MTEFSKDIIVLFDIDHTIFDTQKFWDTKYTEFSLHPEVIEVLKSLENYAKIGIFSEGEEAFQLNKLEVTQILHLFEKNNIHIFEKKMESLPEVLKKYEGKRIVLVDDKLTVLFDAHHLSSEIETVWVKRGYYADRQEPIPGFSPSATVENLEELIRIITER